MSRIGRDTSLRKLGPPLAKCLDDPRSPRGIERWHDPWLIGQFGDIDFPPARPGAIFPTYDTEPIIEQDFCRIVRRYLLWVRCRQPREYEIELTLA